MFNYQGDSDEDDGMPVTGPKLFLTGHIIGINSPEVTGGSDKFGANLGYPYSQEIFPVNNGEPRSYSEFPNHPTVNCPL